MNFTSKKGNFQGLGGNEGGTSGENVNFTSKNCNVEGFGEITWN